MIILDTSFIVAFVNTRDVHHTAAVEAMSMIASGRLGRPLVPEYVVGETLTVIVCRAGLPAAVRIGRRMLESKDLTVVPCTSYMDGAFEIFRAQRGRRLSFTDAAIVAIARSEEIPHVATFDRALGKVKGIQAVP